MTSAVFKIRTLIILTFLLAWAVGASVNLYVYSVRDREKLLKKARSLAWREAVVPARRGQIIDSEGILLAQDIFCCDLVLERRPENARRRENLYRRLRKLFPDLRLETDHLSFPLVLKEQLDATEIREFNRIFRRFPEVRTAGRFKRQVDADPAVRKKIGETALNDRQERVGISGLEQQHDLILSGKPGRIVVMLDRNGSWIYETLRVVRQPENGRNLKLDQSKTELIGNGIEIEHER